MVEFWWVIPAFFMGVLSGIVLMAVIAVSWRDDEKERKWWDE